MNAKKTTRKQRLERMNALAAEVDTCLAELRGIKQQRERLSMARRRVIQERIAALGDQMRQLV
ncbi:MAG TPA: hypothetical protein VNA25_23170 [Phycisphaerae bacterium]|nr:hypothetical protein [Phycisphaerae bacterium]HUT60757.1 hypothetical protein [Phycisphaerae bacterium]